jgi:hypothetical protein
MTANSNQRTRPDSVGSSVWPAGATGIANLVPARPGYVVIVAPLFGSLDVGDAHFAPGAAGIFPMSPVEGRLPITYRFDHAVDAARAVFVTR